MGQTQSKEINKLAAPWIPLDSTTSSSHQPFRFLDLPAELRVQVYEHLLVVGKVFFDRSGPMATIDPEEAKRLCKRAIKACPKPCLSILRVNKQILFEAEPIYLSKNLFVTPTNFNRQRCVIGKLRALNPLYLSSQRAYAHVENLSVSLVQRFHLCQGIRRIPGTWGHWDFQAAVPLERLRACHEHLRTDQCWEYDSIFDCLSKFERLRYLDIDLSRAFCPVGCCRMISEALEPGYIAQLEVSTLRLTGFLNRQEAEKFQRDLNKYIDRQKRCYEIGGSSERQPDDEAWWDGSDYDDETLFWKDAVVDFKYIEADDPWNKWVTTGQTPQNYHREPPVILQLSFNPKKEKNSKGARQAARDV